MMHYKLTINSKTFLDKKNKYVHRLIKLINICKRLFVIYIKNTIPTKFLYHRIQLLYSQKEFFLNNVHTPCYIQ